MISVKCSAISSYLHSRAFYRTLSNEEIDSDIQIPSECFKVDDSVTNTVDLSHMLLVERFWGLDELPWTVMDFYYHLEDHNWKRHELDEYPALFDMWQVFTERRPLDEVMINCRRPELVSFLIEVSSPEEPYATRTAARLGRLDYLIALHEREHEWDERTCSMAAEQGHLDCLMFANENGCPWDEYTLINAATNGHLDCLKYAVENGLEWDAEVCDAAAANGHLPCLQYAFTNGCPWDDNVTLEAFVGGHLACLQFALENGCPIHPHAVGGAAHWGRLECLMLLHQYNASWSESDASKAATKGHLLCLQFLHESGCPWDATTPESAAAGGHEACLRYAISQGCLYNATILSKATAAGSVASLKYLVGELGMYMNVDGSLFVTAMKCAKFTCLQYLVDVGCPMGDFVQGDELHTFGYDSMFDASFLTETPDTQLLQCIEYAARRGWRWNDVFVEFVCKNKEFLSMCWVRVKENGVM